MKPRHLLLTLGVALAVVACVKTPETTIPPDSVHSQPLLQEPLQIQDEIRSHNQPNLVRQKAAVGAAMEISAIAALPTAERLDRENYHHFDDNPLKLVAEKPVSTFSIDVDTGAYANVRRMLMEGRLPPSDAVRAEELINYFGYADPVPGQGERPFNVNLQLGPTPWNANTHLLRIAVKAQEVETEGLPPVNLVFLADVSGSMNAPNKLPLLKRSLQMLSREMDKDDRVSIVVYAGASGVVLEPTAGDQSATIEQALEKLSAGGSTNGGAGIRLAYAKAREAFIDGGINRVILATDGDFNVGTVNHQALLDLIEQQRNAGIALTTLGFGSGNYNDHLMEQLADHGNGNYAYIDSLLEARKVLVEQIGGTLLTVAKDVKIQVEFNPAWVEEYRLIGYENRALRREDFNNDKVDAGEIGAGHSVVALYEIALKGEKGERVDPLRYARKHEPHMAYTDEIAFVKLRYKQPGKTSSQLIEYPLERSDGVSRLAETTDDYRFSAAVAAFAQRLRGGKYLEGFDYPQIIELARHSRGKDARGYRSDFLRMAGLARSLQPQPLAGKVD